MHYNAQRALELLRLSTGQPDAEFREGQEAAIRHIVEGRGRLLIVQKTGWGKSFVYFIATKLLREAGAGPVLLISPLLALMRNQVAPAERMGLRAYRITSDNQEDWPVAEERLRQDEVDILLISPERLGEPEDLGEILDGSVNVSSHGASGQQKPLAQDRQETVPLASNEEPTVAAPTSGLPETGDSTPADALLAKVTELIEHMDMPTTEAEVAERLQINRNQAGGWLQRLVEMGVMEKLSQPARFRFIVSNVPLFDSRP